MTAALSHVELPGGFGPNPVLAAGDGPPLVFLHGLFGPDWSGYLDELSTARRVLAPAHPGGDHPDDLALLDSVAELVLYYDDLFDALGLDRFDLVGHSFGGMVAAEYAATFRERVDRLVLIDPLGLWRDDVPVADHLLVADEARTRMLYRDATHPEIAERHREPSDLHEAQAHTVRQFAALAATAHFIHPIPERGLSKRLRRIAAPTLVLWGSDDGLVPPVYGADFCTAIPDARLELVEGAGHYPHLEQRATTASHTTCFLS